jgi:uncharacterized membrane protein
MLCEVSKPIKNYLKKKVINMPNQKNINSLNLFKKRQLLFITILVLGIFLRFNNLDQKVYNADEVRKIIWLSGYSSEELKEKVYTGDIFSAKDLKRYQRPNSEKNLIDALKVLSGKTEHVPLHHIITRYFMQLFDSNLSVKAVSVILSFLSFPCFYWLCIELFKSPLAGWIATALAAVSPFHILASQNAGSYSLWTVTTLLSSAALIKALRLSNRVNWLIYAITLSLGFYTHLFSLIVAFGQGIYVLSIERLKLTKTLISYVISLSLSLLAFSPWIVVFFANLDRVNEGTGYYDQFKVSLRALYQNIGNIFIDFYHRQGRLESLLHLFLFLLVIYSLYFLIYNTSRNVWLFVLILISLTPLLHIIVNFINPSALHIQSRYYLPSHLGIQLSLTYLLASQIGSTSLKLWQRRLWAIIFLIIVTLGIISGTILMQAREAGLDDQRGTASGKNLVVAPVINKSENPLVVSEATHSFILALLYLVNDDVKFQLLNPQDVQHKLNLSQAYNHFSDVFILYPDKDFLEFIDRDKKFKRESVANGLYKIIKN